MLFQFEWTLSNIPNEELLTIKTMWWHPMLSRLFALDCPVKHILYALNLSITYILFNPINEKKTKLLQWLGMFCSLLSLQTIQDHDKQYPLVLRPCESTWDPSTWYRNSGFQYALNVMCQWDPYVCIQG